VLLLLTRRRERRRLGRVTGANALLLDRVVDDVRIVLLVVCLCVCVCGYVYVKHGVVVSKGGVALIVPGTQAVLPALLLGGWMMTRQSPGHHVLAWHNKGLGDAWIIASIFYRQAFLDPCGMSFLASLDPDPAGGNRARCEQLRGPREKARRTATRA